MILHITHNDGDAVGCALAVSIINRFHNVVNKFCKIGSQDQEIMDIINLTDEDHLKDIEEIIISDLSILPETAEALEKYCIKNNITLSGWDHHKSNSLESRFPWFQVTWNNKEIIDKYGDISAAKFIWVWYKPFRHVAKTRTVHYMDIVIDAISRYDTWRWKSEPNKYDNFDDDYIANLTHFFGPERVYGEIFNTIKDRGNGDDDIEAHISPAYFKEVYNALKDKENKSIEYMEFKHPYAIADIELAENSYKSCIIINDDNYVNQKSEWAYSNLDVDLVLVLYPSSRRVGLRSNKDIDLSEIAKFYNGGEHKSAAGFSASIELMMDLLRYYYLNKEI